MTYFQKTQTPWVTLPRPHHETFVKNRLGLSVCEREIVPFPHSVLLINHPDASSFERLFHKWHKSVQDKKKGTLLEAVE